jgi:hypothetical protein
MKSPWSFDCGFFIVLGLDLTSDSMTKSGVVAGTGAKEPRA